MKKFLIRLLNKFRILPYFNLNGNIYLNGKPFKIPVIHKVGFSNLFMSEPWMIDLLKIVLAVPVREQKFIDVGVNIGQTLLKLKSVSSEVEYIGFDPNPTCINYVNHIIQKNNIENTFIIPVGISETKKLEELRFFNSSETDPSASVIDNFRPQSKIFRKEFIPLFDFDTIAEKIGCGEFSVLKIDVEGAELEVIRSFYQKIKKNEPIILIEILPAYRSDNKERIQRQDEIQRLLKDMGFSIYKIIKQNDILKNIIEIPEIGIHSDLNACEYVMVPRTKKEKFISNSQKILKG